MTTHLIPLLDKLANHRVLCIGDVMLDRYIYGQVERISPEAPIPVMRIQRESVTLGGAGNVVRNIVSLGGHVDLIGIIGSDQAGQDITKLINGLSGITSHLLVDASRPTTLKTRYVADGQQLLRADHEVAQHVAQVVEDNIVKCVGELIGNCRTIILSDYAKGVLSPAVVSTIIALAKKHGAKVLIDPKGRDFNHYQGASILTPNRKELAEISGAAITDVQGAEKAARRLIEAHGLDGILAKLGGDGVCLVMKNQPALHFHATAREVFDVSGAGDTVLATLALALAGGLTPGEAAELANIAGSIVVGKIGTAVVTRDELTRELTHDQLRQDEQKIATLEGARDSAQRWRTQGLKVGFTNGCFDLLHPGHISLLRQARSACDRLIVGLNSDASIKRLKGETRPIQNEAARSAVLASLTDVDQIVVFEDDTPLSVIEAVRPAVLIKGADYTINQVVGGDLVQGWGGKVVLAKLVDGQSTTATIAKLQIKKATGASS